MNKNHFWEPTVKTGLNRRDHGFVKPFTQQHKEIKKHYAIQQGLPLSPKNYSQLKTYKTGTLARYTSETSLKRLHKYEKLDSLPETSPQYHQSSIEHDISGNIQQPTQIAKKQPCNFRTYRKSDRNNTNQLLVRENEKYLQQYNYKSIKKQLAENKLEKPVQLKQTSSSITPDLQKQEPSYPSFFKTKNSKKGGDKSQVISINDFVVLRKLGAGKFGRVLLVKQKRTKMVFAMKVFQKRRVVEDGYLNQFIRQLKLQAYLDHPSIIKLHTFFHDEINFYTLMELACHGQLYELIKNKETLTEETTSYIIKSLLIAADYMHRMKIFHRDIKPENIVLIHGAVKLCDFGWAVHQKQEELRSTYCGTPLYFSPQLLKGGQYDQKVDIWAIGIMAYELRLGSSPFNILSHRDLHKIVTQPLKMPLRGCTAVFRQFIMSILQKNPRDRLSCSELLKLPFISNYQNETCEQLCFKSSKSK